MRFALSKPELIGTYLIDIAAMLFAFPVALFPALSLQWGDARMTGVLFSSMAIGSLIATLLSGWSSRIRRQGRVVVIAAAGWGLFVLGAGLAPTPWQSGSVDHEQGVSKAGNPRLRIRIRRPAIER